VEAQKARNARWSSTSSIRYYCPGRQVSPFYYLKWNPHEPLNGEDGKPLSWKPGSPESGMGLDFAWKPGEFWKFRSLDEAIMREPARGERRGYK
jgi:hypothetical protein